MPFGNLSQKGGVHSIEELISCRGDFCFRGSFWSFVPCCDIEELVESFRLYLGASLCIYILALVRRYILRYIVYVYVSCFTMLHCLSIYIYDVIHDIYLYFVLCEIKKFFFMLLVFSTHAFMCLLSVIEIYRLIQSCCCLLCNC